MPLTRLAKRYHQNPANHIKIISQIEEEMSDVVLTQSGKFIFIFNFFLITNLYFYGMKLHLSFLTAISYRGLRNDFFFIRSFTFHILFGLLFPFSIWTFISLFLLFRDISRHFATYRDIYGHLQTFTNIYRHLQTFDIYGHLWTFTDI